ncbi:MAG: transcriptional regulator [Acidobacteria bacterium]|nr:MAG: transcriptional regulator [Acidobacteriota bacterium]
MFFEGDLGRGFFVVASGKVKVFKVAASGKEQILHIFGEGETFGEVSVFHGAPFPASAEALSAVQVMFFPRDAFIRLLEKNTSIALGMLAELSKKLRIFARKIEDLSLKEVPARLAGYLLYLDKEQQGGGTVVLDISKGQLASLLGTSPETLSRILTRMAAEELIAMDGRTITLLDIAKLADR